MFCDVTILHVSADGFPKKAEDSRVCGICGNEMVKILEDVGDEEVVER